MVIHYLGLVDFHSALELQEQLVDGIASGKEAETLLLLEHPPVYTIGRGGDSAHILDPALRVNRINRGGDATFHGPGQLVGYPLLQLARFGRDLHRYLRFLEEVLIQTAAAFDVAACRIEGRTGIWTERGKLASIGIGVRRWVSMHGFSLNCGDDLSGFTAINPCGMPGCPLTSLVAETGGMLEKRRVRQVLGTALTDLLPEK